MSYWESKSCNEQVNSLVIKVTLFNWKSNAWAKKICRKDPKTIREVGNSQREQANIKMRGKKKWNEHFSLFSWKEKDRATDKTDEKNQEKLLKPKT